MSIRKYTNEQSIFTLGALMAIINDGVQVAKSKDLDVEFAVYKNEDGYYEEYIDVTINGVRVRLHPEFEDDPVNPDSRADLTDLLRELS